MKAKSHRNTIDTFDVFRTLFHRYLKNNDLDGEEAFKQASTNFYVKYGYYPYVDFEDFVVELIKVYQEF